MIFRSQKSLCTSWPPGLCTCCPCDWTIIFLFYTFYPTARVIHIPSNIRFTMDLSKCPACLSDISLSLSPCMHAKSLQLYLTLCDPMDCSLSGFPVYGIVQARILEWVVMPSSRGSSWPSNRTHVTLCTLHWQVSSLLQAPPGKPQGSHSRSLNILHLSTLDSDFLFISLSPQVF